MEEYDLLLGRQPRLGQPPEPSMWDLYKRNSQWAIPHMSYMTTLSPTEEDSFRQWVEKNKVPFQPDEGTQDYDMRGYWKALQEGDPRASFDKERMHFPDYWKTPFHESFSNESIYANPYTAPRWQENQLVTPMGKVIFQE